MDTETQLEPTTVVRRRQAERRAGLDVVLRQVTADVLAASDRRKLSLTLTQRLAQVARLRSVGLKEISTSAPARALHPVRMRDYVAFAVPVKEEGQIGRAHV